MKSRSAYLLVIIILLAVILTGAGNYFSGAKPENERARVEQAIRGSIGWAINKEIDLLYRIIANDSNYLEVHPDGEVIIGFEEFKKAEEFWMDTNFRAIRSDIRDLRITFSRSGDVAWFYCMLDDIATWKGRPASWENTRWTGTMEKRGGDWITVQQHFSFATE